MMNVIWGGIMILSMVYAAFHGNLPETVNAGISSAGKSFMSVISFAGIMCMWGGIMNVAKEAGFINRLSRIMHPVLKRLFRSVPTESRAMEYITLNIACNILGLGNAATPPGMKAMCELKLLNDNKNSASYDMCLFMVLNTASLQLIPTTMIALAAAKGSKNPSQIVLPVWIVSAFSVVFGVLAVMIFDRIKRSGKTRLTK